MNDTRLEILSETIVLNVLNKVRDYYGRNDRVDNEFLKELEEDTKKMIQKATN